VDHDDRPNTENQSDRIKPFEPKDAQPGQEMAVVNIRVKTEARQGKSARSTPGAVREPCAGVVEPRPFDSRAADERSNVISGKYYQIGPEARTGEVMRFK
jgi:hypothetical protein